MLIFRRVSGDELQSLSVKVKVQLPASTSYSFCTATNGIAQQASLISQPSFVLPDDCKCIIVRQKYFDANLLWRALGQHKHAGVEYLVLIESIEADIHKTLQAAMHLENLRVLIIQGFDQDFEKL